MTSNDPLLQPYRLKHLALKNRVMSTAHEPAYSEDGRHAPRARGQCGDQAAASISRPAAFHSGKPSSSRRTWKPFARSAATASNDRTQ